MDATAAYFALVVIHGMRIEEVEIYLDSPECPRSLPGPIASLDNSVAAPAGPLELVGTGLTVLRRVGTIGTSAFKGSALEAHPEDDGYVRI